MVQVKSGSDCAAMRRAATSPTLPVKILLIENDPDLAEEIRLAVTVAGVGSFDVEWVRQLSEGLQLLKKEKIAAVLLELSLPDSLGIETFDKLFTAAPDIPILILGGEQNEELAKKLWDFSVALLKEKVGEFEVPEGLRTA